VRHASWPVGTFPGQQTLNRSRRSDQRQRHRKGCRHCCQPTVGQRPGKRVTERHLQQRGDAADQARYHECAGECVLIHPVALDERVGEERVDRNPQQNVYSDRGRTDADLCWTDQARDDEC
jgi:hypothetical protein